MTRTLGKKTMLALAFGSYTSVTGCSGREPAPPTALESADSTGELSFALQLAGGHTLQSASYTITGPNAFSKTGSIDLSSAATLSATIGGLPAGVGYQIAISGTTTDGTTSCAGSASFAVVARQTTAVTVPLTCHEAPKNGSVMVDGTLNVCPTLDGIGASPAEVQRGRHHRADGVGG